MPAAKTTRAQERRRVIKRQVRSSTRTAVKKAVKAVELKEAGNGAELTATAISLLDRASTKGVLHRNTAARQKSRLMKRLNKSSAE